jgi:cytochrome c
MNRHTLAVATTLIAGMLAVPAAQANDPEALMKRSGCFRCHAVAQEKVGPAYRDVAAKYRGNPGAEQRIVTHITTNPKIRIEGEEQEHVALRNATDADARAVAQWVLSR